MRLLLSNNTILTNIQATTGKEVRDAICFIANLDVSQYYLLQNGRLINDTTNLDENDICICLRLCGGKGGFGSMLRAIGAQIEKTTNREACRDLSGRRLRDINEEKRMKTWLDKQKEKDEETEDKQKKKLKKILILPKIDFKDEAYEQARTELTQQIGDSVEQGFKKAEINEASAVKRKLIETEISRKKKIKKRAALWVGADDLSCSETSDTSDSDQSSQNSNKFICNSVETPITFSSTSKQLIEGSASDESTIDK